MDATKSSAKAASSNLASDAASPASRDSSSQTELPGPRAMRGACRSVARDQRVRYSARTVSASTLDPSRALHAPGPFLVPSWSWSVARLSGIFARLSGGFSEVPRFGNRFGDLRLARLVHLLMLRPVPDQSTTARRPRTGGRCESPECRGFRESPWEFSGNTRASKTVRSPCLARSRRRARLARWTAP